MVSIQDGLGVGEGRWFRDNIVHKVGNGKHTLFWSDHWVGSFPLCEQFSRLFGLAVNKSILVAEMFLLRWDKGGAACQWRCRLWAWEEEMLGECSILLSDILL